MTSATRAPRRRWRIGALLAACLVAAAVLSMTCCATIVHPRTDLLAAATANPPERFVHDELDAVLGRYVDNGGNVDYAALQGQPDGIERYYAQLAAFSPDSHPALFPDQASRLAYWLNAYNGAVLLSVSRLYPLQSVGDVGVPWYLFYLPDTAGFFYLREHVIGGAQTNLYDLENAIVRERFRDPRIHFALNCASAGCPRLPKAAFRAASLDEELDRETRQFFAERRNLTIDHDAKVIHVSQILEWYRSDFVDWSRPPEGHAPTLIDYVARYAPVKLRAELSERAADYAIDFVPYDWRLNDLGVPRGPPKDGR